jgi:uncharacterized membrane protein YecN with MAPEG domain
MEYATIIVMLALVEYLYFTGRVGASRAKFGVEAPACTGNEMFERGFRVQQNTLEQLIIFIPATFAFAYYVDPTWVLLPGAVFIIGRFLYSSAYTKDPGKRAPGMGATLLANAALVLVTLGKLVMGLI